MNSPDSPSGTLNKRQLSALLGKLRRIRAEAKKTQRECLKAWRPHIHWHGFRASADNMGAYIGLRRHDLRDIQSQLAALGLSSLGRTEGHVLANLDAVIHTLEALTGKHVEPKRILDCAQAFNEAGQLLGSQTDRLFGPPPAHRKVRIMVTFPSEAASDYAFVRELVRRGMDCARINCAHDTPEAWLKMIEFVRQAEVETDRSCKILMDLAGPKLRTGRVAPDQSVVHLKTRRNSRGAIKETAAVILDGSGVLGRNAVRDALGHKHRPRLNVDPKWLQRLKKGDTIEFTDLRGKAREMVIEERLSPLEVVALTSNSSYLEEGVVFPFHPHGR